MEGRFDPKTKRAFSVDGYVYRCGPGRSKAYQLIREGKLTAIKLAGRTLITADSAERLLAAAVDESQADMSASSK